MTQSILFGITFQISPGSLRAHRLEHLYRYLLQLTVKLLQVIGEVNPPEVSIIKSARFNICDSNIIRGYLDTTTCDSDVSTT